jgi:hypothetical protein
MSRRALVLVAGALLMLTLVTSAALATPGDRFNAGITPSAVQPLASDGYTVTISNLGSSNDAANNAHVSIPSGFLVDLTSLAAATSSSGSCSGTAWTVALDPVGSTIDAVAPPNPDGDLCPGGTLILTFAASAPSQEGDYEWTTTLFSDSNAFSLQGQQPSVTVDGTPPSSPTLTATPPDPSNSADATFSFTDDDSTASFRCQLDGGGFSGCSSPATYAGLGDGEHTFQVRAVDPAGNQSTVTSYGWTVDTLAPPPPTITSAPPSVTASTEATFAFTDDEAGATFRCKLDDAAFSSCTSPITYHGLGEGSHTFGVRARDTAGNLSAVTSHTWTVDLTPPPAPAITSEPPSLTNSTTATFAFTDGDSSATFRCRLDGGSYSACTSPITYTGLGEGAHTFRVKAVDPAGNESTVTSYSWMVDVTAPPPPTITSAPPDPSNSTDATFAFTDDEVTATFVCKLDGGGYSDCASPFTYSGLTEGSHTFRVKARDLAGNQSAPASYSWTIDVTPPPAPTITSEPPNVTASTTATFAFTDGESSATFRCRLDGGSFSICTSPKTYTDLGEGTHTFSVKAIDEAGNQSTVTSYTWMIDLTNPVVTIDPASEPRDPTNQTSANFVFTSNKEGSTFQCRLDGGAFSSCSSPKAYSSLADGRHSFGVKATDLLGNEGLETIYSWTIDTVPPVTTITSGPAAQAGTSSATFAFTSNEAPPTFACSLDGGSLASCASPKSYTGLADGPHVFQVRATDRAGNTDPTPATYSWRVLTQTPPDTTPPGTVQELTRSVGYRLLRLTWSLPTDADFDHVEVSRSRSAKGAAQAVVYEGNGAGYSDKGFQNGTYYRYEIKAFDQSGNASLGVRVVVPPSALLRSPRDGAVVKAPPLLRWAGVPRATYYNVQVYRGSRKLLSRWPAKARLKLQRSWVYQGHRNRLKKGVYRWWVWPAFGPRSKSNYGRLLGTGKFVVR